MKQPIFELLTPLYFAYGSNLYTPRMRKRVGNCVVFGTHTLYNYELAFNAGQDVIDTAFANIIPKKGASVEGVFYLLSDKQIHLLDQIEGWPFCYEKVYGMTKEGIPFFTYIAQPSFISTAKPELSYLNLLLKGAEIHNIVSTQSIVHSYIKFCINYYNFKEKHQPEEEKEGKATTLKRRKYTKATLKK